MFLSKNFYLIYLLFVINNNILITSSVSIVKNNITTSNHKNFNKKNLYQYYKDKKEIQRLSNNLKCDNINVLTDSYIKLNKIKILHLILNKLFVNLFFVMLSLYIFVLYPMVFSASIFTLFNAQDYYDNNKTTMPFDLLETIINRNKFINIYLSSYGIFFKILSIIFRILLIHYIIFPNPIKEKDINLLIKSLNQIILKQPLNQLSKITPSEIVLSIDIISEFFKKIIEYKIQLYCNVFFNFLFLNLFNWFLGIPLLNIIINLSFIGIIYLNNKIQQKILIKNTEQIKAFLKKKNFENELINSLGMIKNFNVNKNLKNKLYLYQQIFIDKKKDLATETQNFSTMLTGTPFIAGFINFLIFKYMNNTHMAIAFTFMVFLLANTTSTLYKYFTENFYDIEYVNFLLYKMTIKTPSNIPFAKEKFTGKILIRNLSNPTIPQGLKNVTFNIQPGMKLGIMGPSGSGKSLFIKSIINAVYTNDNSIFWEYEKNGKTEFKPKVLFNEKDFANNVLMVTQDDYMFNDSIRYNITLGENFSDNEILNALKLTNGLNIIEKYSDGLNHMVDNRGSNLSGGQKKRISLSRIFLRKPKVLLADEIETGLDKVTANLILNNLLKIVDEEKITFLLISHNLHVIDQMDYIIVIDKGVILEHGTPAQLKEKKGLYYKMHQVNSK